MKPRMNRRVFLKNTAIGGAGLVILGSSDLVRTYGANEKLNVALVGVAGRGDWFVTAIPNIGENVVAMCDVNEYKASRAFDSMPKAKKYNDFRKMLDEMDKEIDAVTVATPDNTHAVISATAIKMGKGVLCEKPLTHDIFEARRLRELAAKHKVATQLGNQGTASSGFREAVEIIQAGAMGEVKEAHVWNTGGGAGERPVPTDEHQMPDYLHWDLWLGPAKYRPYNSRWLEWHSWRDFATGNLGNWASHTMNVVFKGLRIDTLWPSTASGDEETSKGLITLEAEVSGYHKATFPQTEIIRYDVPARGAMPPVRINWYNGGGQAPGPRGMIEEMMGRRLDWGDAGEKKWEDHAGCLLVGAKGMLHSTGHNTSYSLLPKDKFEGFEMPKPTLPRSRGHEKEWADACKGGPAAMSNFNYADPLAEFVLLGNVATQFEGKIEFDPIKMKVVNNDKADGTLRREYRQGWAL
ncbi:MAG TPA: Gfo/Idh/MocA family oxidoreductase [Sedimentisphaerales bacterium]|nr:Gfo/Idh/MocA family oxidoreductase [Sedimentisphaerales bacterium]